MATAVPARLSPAEGRRFGLVVGAAFLGLAALVAWRGGDRAAWALGAIGGLLAAGGLLVPGRMGPVHAAWMKLALLLSRVTTPVFMGLVYFVVLTPTGVLRRVLGHNPPVARGRDSYWVRRATPGSSMDRQF